MQTIQLLNTGGGIKGCSYNDFSKQAGSNFIQFQDMKGALTELEVNKYMMKDI